MRLEIDKLISTRERYLKDRTVHAVTVSLGKLSLRWLNKDYFFRKKAVRRLVERSHFSEHMAHALLDALFQELTQAKLWKLLCAELGDPRVLDEFRWDALTGKRQRARGPRVITHIFSGNVPNPAIVSFVLGMLVKSVNIGKVSRADEGFLDIYLDSLKSFDKKLAATNYILKPDSGAHGRALLHEYIRCSELVVAYGNDKSLEEIKNHVPAGRQWMGYGHRVSFGVYAKEVLKPENLATYAKKTARDIWVADQRGCLSPLEILIETGGELTVADFSGALARALERLYRMKAWRIPAELGAAQLIGFGERKIISVRSVKNRQDILKNLKLFEKYLQAVSLEAGYARRQKIAECLSVMGVNRICRAGQMQRPPVAWHHEGKTNLASWVYWTDLEA